MSFSIIINKWANFYFFVQNLSEWHFSNRKSYNIFWRKILDSFSEQEESALKEFKEIRAKYPVKKSCFEKSFFLSDEPFKKIKRFLLTDEYKKIENIFFLFQNKFEILYKKELPLLRQWQKNLHKTANNKKIIDKISISLNTLYKTSIKKKTVNVYLLFSTPGGIGGGANIDNKNISLEISNHPSAEINYSIGFIWHEVIHAVFQNKYFYPLLRKYFSNESKKFMSVNEVITASVFPEGVLGILLLKMKIKPIFTGLFYGLDDESIKMALNLTKKYLDQNKYFDKEYIKKIDYLFFKH